MKRDWKIGCAGFPVSLEKYFERLTAVEVQETFIEAPAKRTLERWRRQAPDGFCFAIRAWQLITHPETFSGYRRIRVFPEWAESGRLGFFSPGEPVRRAWETVRETARILEARAIVFDTPAAFTPSPENRENLNRFFTDMPRGPEHLVWQPEGMWEEDEVEALCRQLGLIAAVDPLRGRVPRGRALYFRFPAKTTARGGYDADDFYRIVRAVEERGKRAGKEGFLIWSAPGGMRDAEKFRAWFAEHPNG
jgi:uncharacterized protein YecE (DUF72 family)